jgi:hypothetical protein
MASKLDGEISAAMDTGKNAVSILKWNIVANAPQWLVKPITTILVDERTPAFLFGMAFEAAGIAIQYSIGYPAYPILDALTAIVIMGLIIWYQRRKRVQQPSN